MKLPIFDISIAIVVVVALIFLVIKFRPRRIKQKNFVVQWKKLQAYCRHKETWTKAIEEADKLLNRALKMRKYKGKSMGERMVSAQRSITNNDGLWYAHNLCKKILSGSRKNLRESEVRDALLGYRQALRDLGALPNDEARKS